MSRFVRYFPATAWLFTSRPMRWFWCVLLSVLLVATITLRVHAALWAREIASILAVMSDVQVDRTTKARLLERLPGFHRTRTSLPDVCDADECFELRSGVWGSPSVQYVYQNAHRFTWWLGLRPCYFALEIKIKKGTVDDYWWRLSQFSEQGGWIEIGVFLTRTFSQRPFPWLDDSPEYQAGVVADNLGPRKSIEVWFTPTASPELKRRAFDLHLTCLFDVTGCRNVEELMPAAYPDRPRIREAPMARLRGANPCPEAILPRRARDLDNISLVEVQQACPLPSGGITADYKLLRAIKGQCDRPLTGIVHPAAIRGYMDDAVPNPALRVVEDHARLIMFGFKFDSREQIEPCEFMAATPSALQTLETALAQQPR